MLFLTPLIDGFAVMASLIVAVGAQNTFVLRQGLRREHVGAIVLFCIAADVLLVCAGVAGLGAALGRVPGLAPALTLGGVVFLVRYGWGALRRALRPGRLDPERGGEAVPLGTALGRAAAFTLLNPHVYLDAVLLIGAIGAAQPAGMRPSFAAGAALASAAWFTLLGYGARLLAPVFARPAAWRVLDGAVGLTMMTLAAGLLRGALGGFVSKIVELRI